jgi:hypothetical protein
MSLLKSRHLVMGVAALAAVASPRYLLSAQPIVPEQGTIGLSTPLARITVPGIAVALTSPLFEPGRVPPNQATQLTDATEAQVQAPASPPVLPVLVGVILRNHGGGVALAKGADGQTKTLNPGDEIDGWTLGGISRSAAVFTQGGVSQTVTLDFGNRPPAAAPGALGTAPSPDRQEIPLPPPSLGALSLSPNTLPPAFPMPPRPVTGQ